MSKKTKKLIKAIALGNVNAISRTSKNEDDRISVPITGLYLAFFYLLENGRPQGSKGPDMIDLTDFEFNIKDESQLEEFKRNVDQHSECFTDFSEEAIDSLLECQACWEVLEEQKQLHLLDKYQSKLL